MHSTEQKCKQLMSRKSQHLRFVVRDENNQRSSAWRLWTEKSDVYLSVRSLAHALKISLHASGQWQLSLTSPYYNQLVQNHDWDTSKSRHLRKWLRPPEYRPGVTIALRIIFPTSELRSIPEDVSKDIEYISAAPPMHAVYLILIISSPSIPIINAKLLREFVLENGEKLSVLCQYEALGEELMSAIEYEKGKIPIQKDHVRGILIGDKPFGDKPNESSKFFCEVAYN
jgi:hypothetical protein